MSFRYADVFVKKLPVTAHQLAVLAARVKATRAVCFPAVEKEEIVWKVREEEFDMSEQNTYGDILHDLDESVAEIKPLRGPARHVKAYRVSPQAFAEALMSETKKTKKTKFRWVKVIKEISAELRLNEIVLQHLNLEGIIERLFEIYRLVEQIDDDELMMKIRPQIEDIFSLYFPEIKGLERTK